MILVFHWRVRVVLMTALCGLSGSLWAGYTVGFDKSGGKDFSGFSVNAGVDFAPGQSTPYEVFLFHAEQHAKGDFESRSYQYTLGLTHWLDESSEAHMHLTYWRDTLSDLHYGGPTFGVSNTWQTSVDKDQPDWTQAPPRDILMASLNADVFIFGTEVAVSSTTRIVFDPVTGNLIGLPVPASTEKLHVTQLHPNLLIDLLWFDAIKPYVMAGHYFYSRDPARIEELIGLPHLSSAFNQIGGLIGGFFSDSGEVGLRIPLPANLELSGTLGAARSQSTYDWATAQGAALHWFAFKHVDVKLGWNRGIQNGFSTDVYTGGLTVMY